MALRFSILTCCAFFSSTYAVNWFSQQVLSFPLSAYERTWNVISSNGPIFLYKHDGTKRTVITKPIYLKSTGYQVLLNEKNLTNGAWHLITHNNVLTINNRRYHGPATLYISPHHVMLTARDIHQPTYELAWGVPSLKSEKKAPFSCTIRVLIDEIMHHKNTPPLSLISSTGFVIYNPDQPHKKWRYEKNNLQIQCKHNGIFLNGKKLGYPVLRIIPEDGFAGVNNQQYHGSFSLVHENNKSMLINHVELEEYVYSVLKTESWPGWPLEVNKAFAIVSRSYVMAIMKQAAIKKTPYHIKNTNEHQTYRGIHTCMTIRAAIDQTRGMLLTHENKPALTMFDSCCGGVIPAYAEDVAFEKAPYLARTYACKHCKGCRNYAWNTEFDIDTMQKKLAQYLTPHPKLKTVSVTKKDRAGIVHELQLKTASHNKTISGKDFYKAFKEIKSFHYDIRKKGEKIAISGRGLGHHLGLCQWGAREMVRDGWPYQRILQFYYPGTSLQRITM